MAPPGKPPTGPPEKKKKWEWRNGIALNLDYRSTWQALRVKLPQSLGGATLDGESSVETYSMRLEYLPFGFVGLYGILSLHDGSSETAGATTLNLDGWAGGGGFNMAFAPQKLEDMLKRNEKTTIAPFGQIDFNYTHNEFDDVHNAIGVYDASARVGFVMPVGRRAVSFYAGPGFQTFTKKQDISLGTLDVTLDVKPENHWNAIVGTSIELLPLNKKWRRSPLSLVVEGGIGSRQQVLVSLRFDPLLLRK